MQRVVVDDGGGGHNCAAYVPTRLVILKQGFPKRGCQLLQSGGCDDDNDGRIEISANYKPLHRYRPGRLKA